jgi:hypothetical protein
VTYAYSCLLREFRPLSNLAIYPPLYPPILSISSLLCWISHWIIVQSPGNGRNFKPRLLQRFSRLTLTSVMASPDAPAIFCSKTGTAAPECCYPSHQDSLECRHIFSSGSSIFNNVCGNGTCLHDCSNSRFIFGSVLSKEVFNGNGERPIDRYQTCSNVPNMARYLNQNMLKPTILSRVEGHIPRNASRDALKEVTLAVTDCLTATCRNARNFQKMWLCMLRGEFAH